MKLASLAVATLLGVQIAEAKQDRCHAVALSGGANNGAWEAGVLYGLAH